ncbi:glycoside hydrolase family 95 protein [Pedobacter frigiditerrae]|uniref:Glycoside hydrolase family 95 protein n=1 Tax=Pedobacter frigiditerrae TaxID=2530452 RepID=A0A4R0MYI1_9SPHI|nr:glycoside hydrolase family 95 protein [Pedobacter frigiditerrae]TCC92360.1 glycoside hydrolase family 95 protein [Pedobacter frigiditerrae]
MNRPIYVILILFFGLSRSVAQTKPFKLWYDKPASRWEETLPLGNGRLGMMPDGGIKDEQIVLNDITLWSGAPQDANNYEACKYLPEIRNLILAGKNDEAQDLVNKNFVCEGKGSGGANWGCFQMLGNLNIQYVYEGNDHAPTQYKRQLLLNNAIATTDFTLNNVSYKREYFTSFNADVAIIRITADRPGQINCKLALDRPERGVSEVKANRILLSGQLDNGIDGKGMQYLTMLAPVVSGGKISENGNALEVTKADVLTIYLSTKTSYKDADFRINAEALLNKAIKQNYAAEKLKHEAIFKKMFTRLAIDLGEGKNSQLSTDKRLSLYYKNPELDLQLPALFFQYGRYLSISSTRVGLLPPNLQGLWANQVHTPWNGDYHLDVNVQMNHWPLEVVNLSELNLPLADLVGNLVPNGQKTAKAYYNAEGWIAHVITNIWGFTEPGESASWGVANAGSGWLCNNLWDHYAFTKDLNYLKKIYPIIKGSAQFYSNVLIFDPKTNWLMTAPSVSPENSFYMPNGKTANVTMGPTIDNQIVRELFQNVIYAAKTLGKDDSLSKSLKDKLNQLPPAGRISKDGRIMEWIDDYKETDPQHRHISHLYGLYPASLITVDATPDLAEASKKTLNVRGDDGPSWSIAYKLLFWARLRDGNRAFKLFRELLKPTQRTDINYGAGGGVYDNLLSAGPPFQIDGNFGATAGIAEMLIQSHEGYINLLPAIPDEWKKYGSIKGLKARGNYTVNLSWKNGLVTDYRIFSPAGSSVKVKVNGKLLTVVSLKKIG